MRMHHNLSVKPNMVNKYCNGDATPLKLTTAYKKGAIISQVTLLAIFLWYMCFIIIHSGLPLLLDLTYRALFIGPKNAKKSLVLYQPPIVFFSL